MFISIIWDHTSTNSQEFAFLSRPTAVEDQFSTIPLTVDQHFNIFAHFKELGGKILSEAEYGTVSTYAMKIPQKSLKKLLVYR